MKKIMLLVAIAAVSACSKPEPAAEAEATPVAVASAEANIAADGNSSVGKYKITLADGKIVTEEVKADGTYADMVDGKVIETGKWVQKSPSQYCYTKDKPDAVEECNAEKVENGVWTSTNPKGETSKVERVEG